VIANSRACAPYSYIALVKQRASRGQIFSIFFAPCITLIFQLSVFAQESAAPGGLTAQVLAEIAEGTRTIRPEIRSLKTIAVPEPSNLGEFVRNRTAAIRLGKALFWDMQVGSDGIQACATCHFSAGADPRVKNQRSPGLRGVHQDATPNPDNFFSETTGPNATLTADQFPFHVKADPIFFPSTVLRDTNDVSSSQGVAYMEFVDATTGEAVDQASAATDPNGFQVHGINTRRVEPRNTPTVINAVFNHRNLWDGRASNIFNGVSASGEADPNAFVYRLSRNDRLRAVRVSIDNASLASQAVLPPISSDEMSADGRFWFDIGNKFLEHSEERATPLRPLGKQVVHPEDSVLGSLARMNAPGLIVDSYEDLIEAAFHKRWWDSNDFVLLHADGSTSIVSDDFAEANPDNTYSHMEANFSLFFGLAVQLYEATLVSDDSPVDRFLDGDPNALTEAELVGFHIADDEGRCLNCHGQGEFTFAAVSRVEALGITRIRRGDLIDEGFNNIGVRPTLEDLGVGGLNEFGQPLAFARQKHLGQLPATVDELGADLGVDGAFKIPTLRNVALTAPYFHNGGEATLEDVIDFYFRGGNFRTFDLANSHPVIGYSADRTAPSPITGLGILRGELLNSGPGLDDADKANIVAFLKALTDSRVVNRQAPFDGPQLFVPVGHQGDHNVVLQGLDGNAVDQMIEIPAVGADGGTPVPTFNENLAGAGF
jgi:cytochrome c peroxidase